MENIVKEKKLARESNFELLRIVSIIMIIGVHYFGIGGALSNINESSVNYYIMNFFEALFIVGVNCFVLISGYFLINKEKINTRKVINLLVIMAFYGVLFYFIMLLINKDTFNLKSLIKAICPFIVGLRWFVKAYIILFLLSPFINKSLKSLSKKSYQILLVILIFCFSIWPSFLPYPPVDDAGYGITHFIVLYTIAGYIKLHFNSKNSKLNYIILFLGCTTITFLLSIYWSGNTEWSYNSIFNIIASVVLFIFFSTLKIQSKNINYIATFTFGIYMAHGDFQIVDIVYKQILQCGIFYNSKYFFVHFIISIFVLFMLSLFIDIVRSKLFKYTVDKVLDRIKIFNKEIG